MLVYNLQHLRCMTHNFILPGHLDTGVWEYAFFLNHLCQCFLAGQRQMAMFHHTNIKTFQSIYLKNQNGIDSEIESLQQTLSPSNYQILC